MGWQVLISMLGVLEILIIVRVVLSWISGPYPTNPFARMVYQVTDAILKPIQSVLPTFGPLDLSPLVALLLLGFLQRLIANAAYAY